VTAGYRSAYPSTRDPLWADCGDDGLHGCHRQVNPHLRLVVVAVARVRDRHFGEARAAAAPIHTDVGKTRRVVASIASILLLRALAVDQRISQLVVAPLRDLAGGARRIQEARFETCIDVPPGDDLAQVTAAVNEMAARLEEFRRSNLTAVLEVKSALDAMISALPDALLPVDGAGAVVSSNPAAASHFLGRYTMPRTVDEFVLSACPAPPSTRPSRA